MFRGTNSALKHRSRFQSVVCPTHLSSEEANKDCMAVVLSALLIGAASAIGIREGVAHLLARSRKKRSVDDATQSNVSSQDWQPAKVVAQPHPDWKPGMPQPCPLPAAGDFIDVIPESLPASEVYPLVISATVPRPVAFISTVDESGVVNLSPYSFYNAMGFNPPTVAIGLCHSPSRPEGKKDSLRNIEKTGEFVVNIISEWFVEAANHTCGDYPPGVDEMKLAGLTPLPSTKVKAPRVAESAVHMECTVRDIHRVADSSGAVTTSIVIGQVVAFHISSAVAARSPSGRIIVDMARLAPVARCGGVTYARCTELYDMPRPNKDGQYPPRPTAAAAAFGAVPVAQAAAPGAVPVAQAAAPGAVPVAQAAAPGAVPVAPDQQTQGAQTKKHQNQNQQQSHAQEILAKS